MHEFLNREFVAKALNSSLAEHNLVTNLKMYQSRGLCGIEADVLVWISRKLRGLTFDLSLRHLKRLCGCH